MERCDVLIIGGGFAGAATAWWLNRNGVGRVIVLDREEIPGSHASGKNAGIARQAVEDGATALLAARGTSFLREPPEGFCATSIFDPTGGILLSNLESDPRMAIITESSRAAGVRTAFLDPSEIIGRLPILRSAPLRSALRSPDDGLVDIHALLSAYLASPEVLTGVKVCQFQVGRGSIIIVNTDHGDFQGDWIVNAAGAWAGEVADLAGAARIPLTPKRRHLLHTGPGNWVPPSSPYIWSLNPAVYFRTESSGLLLSPCDEAVSVPCTPKADPDAASWLAERLAATFPAMADLPIARAWAELRTFSPDGRFVIGRDTRLSNFLWVAGLDGHGMTCSSAVGELAAALLLGNLPPVDPSPYDPARFS